MRTIDLKKSTAQSNSIIEAAEDFIKQCVAPGAPDIQKADMMMAFMAGAFALYTIEMSPKFCNCGMKEAEENMRGLVAEMENFFAPMAAAGKAKPGIKKDLG